MKIWKDTYIHTYIHTHTHMCMQDFEGSGGEDMERIRDDELEGEEDDLGYVCMHVCLYVCMYVYMYGKNKG